MRVVKFKVATLSVLIILSLISLHVVTALPPKKITVHSSGSIHYFVTRPLYIEGRYIKDDLGRNITLRGVFKAEFLDTCTGWFPRDGYSWEDGYTEWTEQGVRDMCRTLRDVWGANFVGIYIWADWWIRNAQETVSPYRPTTDKPYREAIKDFIRIAGEYDIYVMISVFSPSRTEGRVNLPYPPQHDGSIFPTKEDYIDFYVNNLATELKDYNNVIFCPYDEPIPQLGETPLEEMYQVLQAIIDGIRALPCDNLFLYHWDFCGGLAWIWEHPPLNGTNIVYSGTVYRFHGTFPSYEYLYDDVKRVLENYGYKHVVEDLDLPLVNYLGAANGATNEQEYQAFVNTLACWNEWEQGYAAYQWHRTDLMWTIQQGSTAIQPPSRVGQALIDAIIAGKT